MTLTMHAQQTLAGLKHELAYLSCQVMRAERDWLDRVFEADAPQCAARLRDLRAMKAAVRYEMDAVESGRIR
ncbi:MAG TPA: hypothetical protein DCQ33_12755 [Nitrospira sp.]|nr:hypothetical protein [Nitrospira sp.]